MAGLSAMDDGQRSALQTDGIVSRNGLNGTLPVSTLPSEILAEIFLIHRDASTASYIQKESMSWIRVTHVCWHWRTVGLGYAALWTNINFANPQVARTLLVRAKESLLDLRYKESLYANSAYDHTLQDTLSQTWRLRSLSLENISGYYLNWLLSCCKQDAPVLRMLSLTCIHTYTLNPTPIQISFLRSGGIPFLEKLNLLRCGIPFDLLPASNTLVELRLEGWKTSPRRPSPEAFVCSLKAMTNLEVLVLEECIPLEPYPPSSTGPPVVTWSLRSLRLYDSVDPISNLLPSLCMPNCDSFDFDLANTQSDYNGGELAEVISQFRRSLGWNEQEIFEDSPTLQCEPDVRVTEMEISSECVATPSRRVFHMQFEDPSGNYHRYGGELRLETSAMTVVSPHKLLEEMSEELNFEALDSLDIISLHSWDDDEFYAFFDLLGNLKTVTISVCSRTFAMEILALLAETPLYVPTLTKIELAYQDIGTEREEPGVYTRLWEVLGARKHCLSGLHFDKCDNFSKEDVDALSTAFPTLTVTWDELDE